MSRIQFIVTLLVVLVGIDYPLLGQEETASSGASSESIDFESQILPIIQSRCLKCHSGQFPRGGLSLESRALAGQGGDSKAAIVGGPLAENELWSRLSTDDLTLKMPKGSERLSDEQLNLIQQWIEQGSPWPEDVSSQENEGEAASLDKSDQVWFDREPLLTLLKIEKQLRVIPGRRIWLVFFLLANLVFLVLQRAKRKSGSASESGNSRWFHRIQTSHYVMFLIVYVLSLFGVFRDSQYQLTQKNYHDLEEKYQITQRKLSALTSPSSDVTHLFGDPPRPLRMRHARGLQKTYYRGNCETNQQLYNEGNYCTATFHLELQDEKFQRLQIGDDLPTGRLYLSFEMRRAPGATEKLYSPEIIKSLFLSSRYYGQDSVSDDAGRHQLVTLETDDRWSCTIPLSEFQGHHIEGLVYLYKGKVTGDSARGIPHYGIVYNLESVDGKISETSDVWMGVLFLTGGVIPPIEGKLPLGDWFDVRPLPFIEGENTTDRVLLGIDEHVPETEIIPLRAPR